MREISVLRIGTYDMSDLRFSISGANSRAKDDGCGLCYLADILDDTNIDKQDFSDFTMDSLEHSKYTIHMREGTLIVIFEQWRKKKHCAISEVCKEGDTLMVCPT